MSYGKPIDEFEERDPADRQVDGDWDTLISNPEYRKVFNTAEEAGFTQKDAHVIATVEANGEELATGKYGAERVKEVMQSWSGVDKSASKLQKAQTPPDYEECDDALLDAHEKCVQWNAEKDFDEYDISKSPGIWESDDDVPEWVLDALEDLINGGNVIWQGDYERLPPSAEAEIQQVLMDRMTQPQGWSLNSLLNDLKDHYPDHEDEYLLNILRNETSALLNTAREEAYKLRDDSEEYVFDWIGPTDSRTTDTCLSIEERIEDEGGAVPMPQLKQILYEEAVDHQDDEGTPERVDDWQPHWQCRRTFTRRVQSL